MSHHEKITFPLWSLVSLYVEWVILASHVFRKCLTLIYYDFFWFGMILYDQVWIHSSNYVCYVSQNTVCLLFSFFTPNDLDSNVIVVFFLLVLFWIFSFTCDLVDLEETSILRDLENAVQEPVWTKTIPLVVAWADYHNTNVALNIAFKIWEGSVNLANPCTAAQQASLSITNSQSLLKLMSI